MHRIYDLTNDNAVVYGALICLSSSVLAKLYMSVVWRSRQLGGGKESAAVEETKAFKFDSRAQLNEAEYAPLIIAVIAATSIIIQKFSDKFVDVNFSTPIMVASIGNAAYFWLRVLTRSKFGGTPGAAARYTGLIWIIYNIASKFLL